jgi:hypothetical protein
LMNLAFCHLIKNELYKEIDYETKIFSSKKQ